MSTVIKRCGCKGNPSHASDFQDAKYGQGNRVMSLDQKKSEATCSVCGKTVKL
nr:MAG: hypothetical protein [Caudoviricetes sp.]